MNKYFLEDTRRVLRITNQESQRLHHEYVGTEHLLLALIRTKDPGVLSVLQHLRLDPEQLREQVVHRTEPGPDMVILGRMPYTPRMHQVFKYTAEEAEEMGSRKAIGPVFLLLGVIRETNGQAGKLLSELGVLLSEARYAASLQIPVAP